MYSSEFGIVFTKQDNINLDNIIHKHLYLEFCGITTIKYKKKYKFKLVRIAYNEIKKIRIVNDFIEELNLDCNPLEYLKIKSKTLKTLRISNTNLKIIKIDAPNLEHIYYYNKDGKTINIIRNSLPKNVNVSEGIQLIESSLISEIL